MVDTSNFVFAQPPLEFDPENAILFLGAGFSAGASNVEKRMLPLGNPLKERIAELLSVGSGDYDLQTLSQEFAQRDGEDLYNLLYGIFTITKLLPEQAAILSHHWRRIYTTNYDDAIENHDPRLTSYSYDDTKPRNLPKRFVVHLHGTIRKANPANILSQLILNETSYVRQIAEPSPWLNELSRDLRFASVCYFVGYSLADHHIMAVMHQSEEIRNKTFFITNSDPSRIFINRVRDYGGIVPVGMNGFSEMLKTMHAAAPINDIKQLKSFKFVDPSADQKSTASITPLEVLNLITYGKFVLNRYIAAYPAPDYVVSRNALLCEALDLLQNARTLLIHSRLGNGKTIFTYSLALAMATKGFKSFYWRQETDRLPAEIELMSRSGRIFIIIDDFDIAVENIARLSASMPESKFAVTARSSQQAVRYHEVREHFPSPVRLVAVDKLDAKDKSELISLLDRSGLSAPGLKAAVKEAKELRDVILAFYRNREVSKRVASALGPMLLDDGSRFVLIAAHLGRWAGADLTSDFISRAGQIDAYFEIMKHAELAQDLFSLDGGIVGTRSSLLSQYLLEDQFSAEDMCNACHSLILAAVDRKSERRYKKLMSGLMQVGNLKQIMHSKENALDIIARLFERLARDSAVNKEPLFWLQFAILMMDKQNYAAAESYLDTSYDRANTSFGFETYQLDTQALRIALTIEAASNSPIIERTAKIHKGLQDVLPMITDDSHRFYAIKILELVEPFCINRTRFMNNNDIVLFVFEIRRLIQALSTFDSYLKAQTASDKVILKLEFSISTLIKS